MDDSNPNPRKRPRPVVSCLRCREKKLKCDRATPCENCVKASTAHTCSYKRNGLFPPNDVAPVPIAASAGPLEDLQLRMARVEELLGVKPASLLQAMDETGYNSLGTVVVKGDRSVYHGPNDRVTLLNQFLDVKDFINNGMSKDDSIQASAKLVQFLQSKSTTKITSPDSVVEPEFSVVLLKLRDSLPPKPYCDRLVSIYCNHFERTMRVLHIPTFMLQYEHLWEDNNTDAPHTTSITPQLTVVMAMAYHMEDASDFVKDQSHRSYLKRNANDLVQAWLDELSRKQRTELSTLQVEVLLLLSRSLRGMHPEKLWSSTGALVRSGMVMGLHLNSTTVTVFTPYQTELRRRLWATILEMDLQASIATGMPVVLPSVDPSSLKPSNLNDLDFDTSTKFLPESYSSEVYTDSSYQVVLASSLASRLEALSAIQRSTPDLKDAVRLGRKIETCIDRIPHVVSLHHNGSAPLDGGSLMHRVLLDLYLRRPVLCLYKAVILGLPQDMPAYAEIQRRCLDFSSAVLSYQDLYTVAALSAVTSSPMALQNFFYRCCKLDVLWAALTCCRRIKIHQNETPATSAGVHDSSNISSLVNSVESTIDYLVFRIGQKGSDLKDLVFIALALQASQLPETSPMDGRLAEDRSYILKQTVGRILSRCRERLLQPILANEHLQPPPAQYLPPPTASTMSATTSTRNQPTSNAGLALSTLDTALPIDCPVDTEQWFRELPDLAAEFNSFQVDISDHDIMNFGVAQNWNWEHMWQ